MSFISACFHQDLLGRNAEGPLGPCLILVNSVNVLLVIYFEISACILDRELRKRSLNCTVAVEMISLPTPNKGYKTREQSLDNEICTNPMIHGTE